MWDNGGRNRKLDEATFIDMSPQSGDSRLSMEVSPIKTNKQTNKTVSKVG